MPADAPLRYFAHTDDFTDPATPVPKGKAWMRGLRCEFIGLYVADPPSEPAPLLIDPAYRGFLVVQIWRARIFHGSRNPLWWEMLWQPGQGHRIVLNGAERLTRSGQMDAAKLSLPHLQRVARGRRLGDTDRKREDVFADAEELLRDDAANCRARSVEAIGAALGIDRDTWFRYLRRWPELKALIDARPRGKGERL